MKNNMKTNIIETLKTLIEKNDTSLNLNEIQQDHFLNYPNHIEFLNSFQYDGDVYYTIKNERFPMVHVITQNGTHLTEEFSF